MFTGVKVRRIQRLEVEVSELPTQLRGALDQSGKSASKLCAEVGISRTYWYRLINGEEEAIAEETLRKIEEALGANFGANFESDAQP